MDFTVEEGKFCKIGKISGDGIDLKEQEVFPGLIDIHTHGCMGVDAMDNQPEDLSRIYAGMAPLHHRTPGVIGAAMDKNIYAQVICDGLHVHPAVVRMLYKVFGPQ